MSISMFKVETDRIDRNSWDQLITQFEDASLYQTWSFGASDGARSLSHIILKAGEEILGCCQVAIRRLPFLNIGIADIVWGPLCLKKGKTFNPDVLFNLLHGIKDEYAIKQGYMLRIWPHAIGEQKGTWKHILEIEGFKRNGVERPYRTLLLDLYPSLDDLRKNLTPRWRTSLNKAERNGLIVIEGTSDEFFKTFLIMEKECRNIKKFQTGMNYEAFRIAQNDLIQPLKMRFMICQAQGKPVCSSAYSAIGNRGVYTLGATGEKGYGLNAAYLLQWQMIKRLKENGVRYYDLGGIDAELNPGVYQFKRGVVGKKGWEEVSLGGYHGCFNFSGQMSRQLLNCAKTLRGIIKKHG